MLRVPVTPPELDDCHAKYGLIVDEIRKAIRDEWFAVGTETLPADRAAAESAIAALYAAAGETIPEFEWIGSPRAALRKPASRDSLREPYQADLRAAMETVKVSPAGDREHAALWSATRVALGHSLEANLGGLIEHALRAEMDEPVRQEEILDAALWGQQDAAWIAFHDARRRLGYATFTAQATEQLDLWLTIARSCGWWWPYRNRCVISERPESVVMQSTLGGFEHRLHNDTGPALRFRDGWEVYAWEGTRVPRGFIETVWSVAGILAEPRLDVRICAIKRMGWATFMARASFPLTCPTVTESDGDTLTLYDVPERLFGVPARMLVWIEHKRDAQGHQPLFACAVPPGMTDPVEAVEWVHDNEGDLPLFDTKT